MSPNQGVRGYELQERVGAGGFGEVYRAYQPAVGRQVAIKVILPQYATHPEFIRRFEGEARLIARLEHPHIVPLYDYWRDADTESAYLVMRWLGGGNLYESLGRGPWDLDAAARLLDQIAGALDVAHRQGVVHRDVKPENILLDEDGNAYLSDFGIAKDLVHAVAATAPEAVPGSLWYISPEQAQSQPVTPQSDLYSLGLVMYEVLMGEHPFHGLTPPEQLIRRLTKPLPPLRERRPDLPAALDTVLQRATAKDRAERYPNALAFAAAFREALTDAIEELAPIVRDLAITPKPPDFLQAEVQPVERPVFVARERELARLDGFLELALAREGQVVFVTGGPGRGKTALLGEFARRAMESHPDLLAASGSCNAFSGVGDPYLPFRDVMAMLTGDVESQWAAGAISRDHAQRLWAAIPLTAQALMSHGPHLVDVVFWGEALLSRATAAAGAGAPWLEHLRVYVERQRARSTDLEQSHLFEQVTNALHALSQDRPLLLILDDLQWADEGSIGLLFHLGRRLVGARILIAGAYRPEEVAVGRDGAGRGERVRHPLEKVLAEFKRDFGDVWLDLARVEEIEGREFVDALLETEPNRLGEGFRRGLFQHTEGHPLFTVELLRAMQERGDLIKKEGYWDEGEALNWDTLPPRVEGVIQERVGQLESDLHEILTLAAVEGEIFTAEVVAHTLKADELEIVRTLGGELDRRHHLVSARGVRRLNGQRVSQYRFRHILFQRYLYNSLDPVELAYLHQEVGSALESLYGGRPEEVASVAGELARHYAGNVEKERHYSRLAGERAAQQYANEEALRHLNRALELTPEIDIQERYGILLTREEIYHVRGNRREQGRDLAVLAQLGEALDTALQNESRNRVIVLLRQARYHRVIGDYSAAIAAAQDAISLAQSSHNAEHEAEGYLAWGRALLFRGENAEAQSAFGNAVAAARSCRSRRLMAHALRGLGGVAFRLYNLAAARDYWEQALKTYRDTGDEHSEGATLNNLGLVAWRTRDFSDAKSFYKQALGLVRKTGYREGEGSILNNLGLVMSDECDYAGAEPFFEQALAIAHQIGDRNVVAETLRNLGRLHSYRGSYSKASDFAEEALLVCREIGHRRQESWLFYDLGVIAVCCGDLLNAKIQFEHSLRISQEIDDPLGEGLALVQLGDVLNKQGIHAEALTCIERASCILSEVGDQKSVGWALTHRGLVVARLGDYATARTCHEAAQDIFREIGDLHNEAWAWANMGLLAHQSGDNKGAREYSKRALKIAESLGTRDEQGYALTNLGHALASLGSLLEAAEAYREALAVRRELGQHYLAPEPLAGLARISLAKGNLSAALRHVDEILSYVERGSLDGTDEPFRVYLTCYRVLHANQDPRAEEILMTAHSLLQQRAAKIEDGGLRRSFLENVVAHREILAAW